jgi:hypothetical protein
MNLHISYDEKFLDPFILNAARYTNSKNIYIVIETCDRLKHVKTKDVLVCKPDLVKVAQIIESIINIDRVYFHSFSELFSNISRIPLLNLVDKYLLFYGAEVFNLRKYELSFYLPKTKSYIKNNQSIYFTPRLNPIELRREIVNFLHYRKLKTKLDHQIISALKDFKCVGHFIEEDVNEYIIPIAPKIKWINWNYFGMDVGKDNQFKQENSTLNKLLVGNSASPFNNHLDALKYLINTKVKLELIVPLSYSGSQQYIKTVIETGVKHFKERFLPITDFLPMKEYYELMKDVKAAVFFNLRSQAAGNILWLLTNNIPVFMLEENNLFKMLTKSGIVVYSLQKDLHHFLNGSSEFSAHLKNYIYIEKVFGDKAMMNKYQNLFDTI